MGIALAHAVLEHADHPGHARDQHPPAGDERDRGGAIHRRDQRVLEAGRKRGRRLRRARRSGGPLPTWSSRIARDLALGSGPRMTRRGNGKQGLQAFAAALALTALLCLPAAAGAHATMASQPRGAMLGPAACGGAAIAPTQVFTGEFDSQLQGSFVLLPFPVPAGTTAVRVKYCWDPGLGPFVRHTLDLGLYEARDTPGELYDAEEFRGWGGSSHPDVIISNEGFKSEAAYVASPRTNEPGKTTRGFIPGPVKPGEWA